MRSTGCLSGEYPLRGAYMCPPDPSVPPRVWVCLSVTAACIRSRYSRARVAKAGLSDRVTIHWQSMWEVDLSPCDVITTYQHTMVMAKLEEVTLHLTFTRNHSRCL